MLEVRLYRSIWRARSSQCREATPRLAWATEARSMRISAKRIATGACAYIMANMIQECGKLDVTSQWHETWAFWLQS